MDEFNPHQDSLLNSALNKLPVAPLPPNFVAQVLEHVQAVQTTTRLNLPTPPIRFRLQFLDIALALFCSGILAIIWLIILWGTGNIQFNWLPTMQPNFTFIDQFSMLNPSLLVGGVILFLLEISLLGLVGLNLLGERPS